MPKEINRAESKLRNVQTADLENNQEDYSSSSDCSDVEEDGPRRYPTSLFPIERRPLWESTMPTEEVILLGKIICGKATPEEEVKYFGRELSQGPKGPGG